MFEYAFRSQAKIGTKIKLQPLINSFSQSDSQRKMPRERKIPSPEPDFDFFAPHPHPTKVRVINSMFGSVPDAFDGKTLELGKESPRRQKKTTEDATATPTPEPEPETKTEPEPVPVEEVMKPSVASEVKAMAWDTSDRITTCVRYRGNCFQLSVASSLGFENIYLYFVS
ncbi:unnamed protein product [Mytilus edulis]|uniref:Uncharacterized protein n=1 Tax=Mytilus edulis TaxID=6550 RepID=A0A8S3U042_MYTED|nr:unnamed protein product [Mytilus edulis]